MHYQYGTSRQSAAVTLVGRGIESRMKLKHLESALQPVIKYSDLGMDNVNVDLEQYRFGRNMRSTILIEDDTTFDHTTHTVQ